MPAVEGGKASTTDFGCSGDQGICQANAMAAPVFPTVESAPRGDDPIHDDKLERHRNDSMALRSAPSRTPE